MKNWTATLLFLAGTCVVGTSSRAVGQMRWPDPPKKEQMRVRLIAVALADPRSTYFSSHEVFIAETEIGQEEWKLIKLVYTFLPYQPRLLETGFDYSVVHEMSATRATGCDQTVADLMARSWPSPHHEPLRYAKDVPQVNLDRRRIPLPCYETSADDYAKSTREPIGPAPEPPVPVLKERRNPGNSSQPAGAKGK